MPYGVGGNRFAESGGSTRIVTVHGYSLPSFLGYILGSATRRSQSNLALIASTIPPPPTHKASSC